MVYFERPIHAAPPPPPSPLGPPQERMQGVGRKVFDATTEFYDWLMGTSLSTHTDQAATYQQINQLLRIADCSSKQGQFLTGQDENRALECLKDCREQLYDGEIRPPAAIGKVLSTLTENNPKALLVAKLTEMEYRYCIYPSQKGDTESDQEIQHLFQKVVEEISPRLLDIKALELARELTSFLDTDKPSNDLKPILQNWLSSNLY